MRSHIHPHLRKRAFGRGLEPVPARSALLRLLDTVVYIVGVLGPAMTLPQIIKIFLFQNADGVSALTWGAYALFDIPWIIYGLVHREPPIAIAYFLWLICNSIVFFGALTYGTGLW